MLTTLRQSWLRAAGVGLLLQLAAVPATADGRTTFSSGELAARAAAAPRGVPLTIADVEVPATSEILTFEMERFEVFTRDAQILIHREDGDHVVPRPENVYFRGAVAGEPGSLVFLGVRPDGKTRGLITRPGHDAYMIDSKAAGRLVAERVDGVLLERSEPWKCAQDKLTPAPDPLAKLAAMAQRPSATAAPSSPPGAESFLHTARIAIETDYEFLHLTPFGGSTVAATDYIGELIGFASTIYENQIQTDLAVSSISFWDVANAGADPWVYSDTTCALLDFGRYWNLNNGGVSRTISHFLSGKNVNAGVAWVGVLCSGAFVANINPPPSCSPALPVQGTPWGGGYGYTSGIDGNFDPNNPQVIWDIYGTAHEIGHNFNSPHTHCYNGIGNANPVDQCYNGEGGLGCYAGAQTLPGPAGAGTGTLMSYCHFRAPGMSNIGLTFGNGHGFGVQPQRVPSRMSDHVASISAINPSCLAPIGLVFAGDFENGSLPSPWGAVTP
jgi:hypothetical protein